MSDYTRELEELTQSWDVSIAFNPAHQGGEFSVRITARDDTFGGSGRAFTYRAASVRSAVLLAWAGGPSS